MHHRPGRCPADPIGRRDRIIAFKQGNPARDKAKYNTLDDTIIYIVAQIHCILHLAPVGTVINPQHDDAQQVTTVDTDGTENGRQ